MAIKTKGMISYIETTPKPLLLLPTGQEAQREIQEKKQEAPDKRGTGSTAVQTDMENQVLNQKQFSSPVNQKGFLTQEDEDKLIASSKCGLLCAKGIERPTRRDF